jgi:cation/acetate symporter
MRFFTVSNAKEARKSVLYASGFVAYFFNVIFLLGLTGILIVGQNGSFFEGGKVGGKLIGGGNMVAMHLAKAVGGNLLLGFLAAVAFATILAVVSGLALAGASAISHDLYSRVIMKGKASEITEIQVSKVATICLGFVAIVLGILFEKQNIAFMVGLAFGVAAAANFPVLILSMYWRGLTTRGALWGGYGGLVSAVLFVVFSKSVWVDVIGRKAALFPYTQPALLQARWQCPRQGRDRGLRGPVRPSPDGFRRFHLHQTLILQPLIRSGTNLGRGVSLPGLPFS